MKVCAYTCIVEENVWANDRYKRLILRCPIALTTVTQPGQFYQLACPVTETDQPFLRRPMSVYAIGPDADKLGFLYQVKGSGTRTLEQLPLGAPLNIVGPLGRGFTFSPSWDNVLMVARGVGLATMAPLVPLARVHGVGVTAILSARCPGDLLADEFLQGTQAHVYSVFDSDGTSSETNVEALLIKLFRLRAFDMVYTCGSNRLIKLLRRQIDLRRTRAPMEVALEQQMACGMGVCLSCVRLFDEGEPVFRRVCRDGPVFPIGAIAEDIHYG